MDYTVVGAFMKIFKTKSKPAVEYSTANCRLFLLTIEKCKFLQIFSACENIIIYVVIVLIALTNVLVFYAAH